MESTEPTGRAEASLLGVLGVCSSVRAWLASVASIARVDLEQAASRYANGCPRCGAIPFACPPR